MTRDNKRSGVSLSAAGAVGVLFFWLTDPLWGPLGRWIHADDLIDAINHGRPGTIIGLAGSGIVLLIGLWLMSRRTA
jgi:hypothetical protein